ncbi:MAG: Nif11-like leader peptide family natural product precursor [Anaerolineae bacterium]|nr:Nif11-like leader peptide family natural product precursor [Anaerolineae bacterium]
MALETARKFLERLEREETLRQQLYINGINDLEKLLQFAQAKGFVCRAEDLAAALTSFKPSLPTASLEPLKQLVAPKS